MLIWIGFRMASIILMCCLYSGYNFTVECPRIAFARPIRRNIRQRLFRHMRGASACLVDTMKLICGSSNAK
uniref:Putative secreted protein n=1 Tax=Rhipicephalus microplus TaxID=6941 RepID=A0A6G5A0K0_RHIMP